MTSASNHVATLTSSPQPTLVDLAEKSRNLDQLLKS